MRLSASFGVAGLDDHEALDRLTKRADLALYRAKRLGRNRVELADDEVQEG
ncbi:diguanylate cyclase domain-containing protein [Herbaspirillum sp. B65]|uniref:diguanylate cyclase domain-containing protein n=1 Tax=Herbaspirillum sp. B65 TaxID=137708 RepID=UPI00210F483C|nr:diguanylate cyclase [Herbaspirillum sp. B65]